MEKPDFKKTNDNSAFYRVVVLSKKILYKDNHSTGHGLANSFLFCSQDERYNQQKRLDLLNQGIPVDSVWKLDQQVSVIRGEY